MTLSVFDEGGYRVVILFVMCSKPCPCHQVFFLVLTMRSNVSIRCFESHSPCSVLLNNLQILCTSRAREARINQFVLADLQDSCPTQGLAFPTLTRYRRYRMSPPLQVYSRMTRLGNLVSGLNCMSPFVRREEDGFSQWCPLRYITQGFAITSISSHACEGLIKLGFIPSHAVHKDVGFS